jgi:mRNA interferase YafQ
MEKRGKDFIEFKKVILLLLNGDILPIDYTDHPLIGKFIGTRECHIEPDWLLIYESSTEELVLIRTGTHSDLFNN